MHPSQSLTIVGAVTPSPRALHILIPVPAFTPDDVVLVRAGAGAAEWADAVVGCFPDAKVKAFPDAETAAIEAGDDVCASMPATPAIVLADVMQHTHGRGFAEPIGVCVGTSALTSATGVSLDVATSLLALYPRPRFAFVALRIAPGATTVAVELTSQAPAPGLLWAPCRSGFACVSAVSTAPDGTGPALDGSTALVKWDCHLVSAGTLRAGDWRGGGKTPTELSEDMRHRFASGTYKRMTPPCRSWSELRSSALASPQVRDAFHVAGESSHSLAPPDATAGRRRTRGSSINVADGDTAVVHVAAGARSSATASSALPQRSFVSFGDVSVATTGTTPHAPQLPLLGAADVLRMKKVALGPDIDVLLALDDGSTSTESMELE